MHLYLYLSVSQFSRYFLFSREKNARFTAVDIKGFVVYFLYLIQIYQHISLRTTQVGMGKLINISTIFYI